LKHLLVTNDFPPKVGGIQSYLWELWRRLPPDDVTVLTTAHPDAAAFDADQPFRVVRSSRRVLLPTPGLTRRVDQLAREVSAEVVLLDPVVPVGVIGPRLERPFGVVVHGAEVTIPGRLPVVRAQMAKVLRGAQLVVAAGGYPAREAERAARGSLPTVVVPPGVDVARFEPLDDTDRATARRHFDVDDTDEVVVSVSRLVPRKGMDVLIEAAARLAPRHPRLRVLIAGSGRDERRLRRSIERTGAPARLVGRVSDAELPAFYGCADVFAMLCRNRWVGLEQEGFGIVFLEAAAAGVAQIAGRSGGSHEAVDQGVSGLVVDDPRSVSAAAQALGRLLDDAPTRAAMGRAARVRAVERFTYDTLADQLAHAIDQAGERR
jgi:phosphatidylinositol alpha-1,6-mannosyltransferase